MTTRSICARCQGPFSYVKRTKPRLYCDPCKRLEYLENCRVASKVSYETRIKPRRQAEQARRKASLPAPPWFRLR
jgi:hypothetical protein